MRTFLLICAESGHAIDLSSDSNVSVEALSVSNIDNQLSIPKPSLFGNFAANYGNHSTASRNGPQGSGSVASKSSPTKERFPAPTTPKKTAVGGGVSAGGSTHTPGVAMVQPAGSKSEATPVPEKSKAVPAAASTAAPAAVSDPLSPSHYSPAKPLQDIDLELNLSKTTGAKVKAEPSVDSEGTSGLKKVKSIVPALNLPSSENMPLHSSNPNAAAHSKATDPTAAVVAASIPPAHLLEKDAVAHDLKVQQSLDTSMFELEKLRRKTNEARLQWDKAVMETPAAGGAAASLTKNQLQGELSPVPKLGGTLEDEDEVKRFQKGAKPYEVSATKQTAVQQPSVVDPQDSVADDIMIDTLIAKKISFLQGQSVPAATATAATAKAVKIEEPKPETVKSMKAAPSSNTLDNIAFFDSAPSFIIPKSSLTSSAAVNALSNATVAAAVAAATSSHSLKALPSSNTLDNIAYFNSAPSFVVEKKITVDSKPKAVPMVGGKPDFVQMYKRAQIVDQRWPWTCLFDKITDTTFYRNESEKTFQVEQPASFDPVILAASGGSVASAKPLPVAASSLPHVAAAIQSASSASAAIPISSAKGSFEYVKDHSAAEEVAVLLAKSASVTAPVVVAGPPVVDPSPATILPGETASDMVARFKKDLLMAQQQQQQSQHPQTVKDDADRMKSILLQTTEPRLTEVPVELVQKHLSLTDQLLAEKKSQTAQLSAAEVKKEADRAEEEEREMTFLTFSNIPNSLYYKGEKHRPAPASPDKKAADPPAFETRDGIYDEYRRPAGLDEEGLVSSALFVLPFLSFVCPCR